jgi:ATP-dependent phosphofructokinase / diphosphate-dependent phosphofructokinase
MTGGGDCPGLNAVIRAVVRVGIEQHSFSVLGIEDAFAGLVDPTYASPDGNRELGARDVRGILSRGGTILGTSNRSDPFRYVVRDDRGAELETDVSDRVLANFKKLGLDALVSIGGDGSMSIAHRFAQKGLPVVGVPKTIDNDLGSTDQTFGFDTAVGIATDAIDRLRDTAESHDRVMLVEVMGRDAGFIALHAGIAGGADAILIPEIPYRIEPIAEMIRRRSAQGQRYSIVVVSEGAKPVGGEASITERRAGAMPKLEGAAQRVAEALKSHVRADLRVTVLGHVQRGGSPSNFDRVLATRFGRAAADCVAARQFGCMVALRNGQIVSVPLADAVARPKRVEPRGELVMTARAVGTVFGDEDLVAPTT